MYAGTMQTLVVIFPVHLPVAGNDPAKHMTDGELAQTPAVKSLQRLIEHGSEGRWIVGQCDKHEAVPLGDGNFIKREVLKSEARGVHVRGCLQQLSAKSVPPVVVRAHDARRRKLSVTVPAERSSS